MRDKNGKTTGYKRKMVCAALLVGLLLGCLTGCGSEPAKPTLAEWLADSDDVAAGERETNAEFANAGLKLRLKYSADGDDVLVISYIHEEYQNLAGRAQSEIDATFAEMLNTLGTSAVLPSLFDACEEDAGIILKYIRVQVVNEDGTVIYSQDYYDIK